MVPRTVATAAGLLVFVTFSSTSKGLLFVMHIELATISLSACTCIYAGQCSVSSPTIIANSEADAYCRVASQCLIRYTCTHNGSSLFWTSSIFGNRKSINLIASYTEPIPPFTVNGVRFSVTSNGNATCFSSVLTINAGSLSSLLALNGTMLMCSATNQPAPAITTIRVPGNACMMLIYE